MGKEMVIAVKQALREIEKEKLHVEVHGRIALKLSKETPFGKIGMGRCGICDIVIEHRPFEPSAVQPPTTNQEKEND